MPQSLSLGNLNIEVVLKDIKNVHLGVYPPHGHVRIAAPRGTRLERLRIFAISKLAWIRQEQRKLQEQLRETPREYINRESHFVWGNRYLLKVTHEEQAPSIELKHRHMLVSVRPDADTAKINEIVEKWYRELLKAEAPRIIAKWEPILRVRVGGIFVQRMRTKWGGCKPSTRTIRLNTDLAKKPKSCLEYILVHEMVHLIEPTHNERFVALMDRYLPRWRLVRRQLNSLPVRHEDWHY
jgi:predicted metal-dependent hydrolase